MPIILGKDPGLPAKPPVFDFEELRKKNEEIKQKHLQKKKDRYSGPR